MRFLTCSRLVEMKSVSGLLDVSAELWVVIWEKLLSSFDESWSVCSYVVCDYAYTC